MTLSAGMTANDNKPGEYSDAARTPQPGATRAPDDPVATASTSTETIASAKAGSGEPLIGLNPTVALLDRVRADSSGQELTTNQGVPVADNQNSLKVGLRPDSAGRFHPPRENHSFRSRAHP